MKAAEIIARLRADGRLDDDDVRRWVGLAERLAVVESFAADGLVPIITHVKTDGKRTSNRYTVILNGPFAGPDEYFRKDGDHLDQLLDELIEYWARKTARPL